MLPRHLLRRSVVAHQSRIISLNAAPSSSTSSFSLAYASGNFNKSLFSTSTARAQTRGPATGGSSYYVATLPWADAKLAQDGQGQQKYKELIKAARLAENETIVASSLTTSKRSSPIDSHLKAQLDDLTSTSGSNTESGAWVLLRASSEEEAHEILSQANMSEIFDLKKSSLESINLEDETATEGPLYANAGPPSSSSSNSKNASGNGEGKTVAERRDDGKGFASTTIAENASIGGHEVETNGPLYGK